MFANCPISPKVKDSNPPKVFKFNQKWHYFFYNAVFCCFRYYLGVLSQEMENWASQASGYFKSSLGLEGSFALKTARLFIALYFARLNPRITSGWRDPAHQAELQRRYDHGDRAGYLARPASNSKHTATNFLGNPASLAVDIPCDNNVQAAQIARTIGIGSGINFSVPDPGHYFSLEA